MLENFSSKHPTNEFAPNWSIPMYRNLFNFDECNKIYDWILDNKEEFLKYPAGNSAVTDNPIGERLGTYNLFDYKDQFDSLQTLYNYIQSLYLDFVAKKGAAVRECDIIGWVNILEKGEKIKSHHHGANQDSYISGNVHLKTHDCYTVYVSPWDNQYFLPQKTNIGNVSLFPTYLEHFTTEHTEDIPRVSISFDIVLHQDIENSLPIPFINEEILKNITEDNAYAQ